MEVQVTALLGFRWRERALVCPDWIQQTVDKVAEVHLNLLAAQSRQKKYADVRRRELEFEVGDHVLLRVSPTKGILRIGTKGKLSPRYIGPFVGANRSVRKHLRLSVFLFPAVCFCPQVHLSFLECRPLLPRWKQAAVGATKLAGKRALPDRDRYMNKKYGILYLCCFRLMIRVNHLEISYWSCG
jgi:hypothetical protein